MKTKLTGGKYFEMNFNHELEKYIVKLCASVENFENLAPIIQSMVLQQVEQMRNEELGIGTSTSHNNNYIVVDEDVLTDMSDEYMPNNADIPELEYKRSDDTGHWKFKDAFIRHGYLANIDDNHISMSSFINAIKENIKKLEQEYGRKRKINNIIMFYLTDENKTYPISLSKIDVARYGLDHCINKVMEKNFDNLYTDGSGAKVIEFMKTSHIDKSYFHIMSVKNKLTNEKKKKKKRDHTHSFIKHEKNNDTQIKYFVFDFETVVDKNDDHITPYGLSISEYDNNGVELSSLSIIDDNSSKIGRLLTQYLREHTPQDNNIHYLIGYNNSKFDNFLLVEYAQNNALQYTQPFIFQNSILGVEVNNFIVRDLYKFVVKPLKEAALDFKCDLQKEELEHHIVQTEYYKGEENFKEYLNNNLEKIKNYMDRDVDTTAELFFKVKKAYNDATGLNIEEFMTLPSLSKAAFEKTIDDQKLKNMPINDDKDIEVFIRKALIGGRSQTFIPKTHLKQHVVQGDVKSLYPHLMNTKQYTLYQPIWTDEYKKGKIGVYEVKIIKQPEIKIVPKRSKNGLLNWDYDGEFTTHCTSVIIEQLKRYGAKIEVGRGVYWKYKTMIFDNYITNLYNMKKHQDDLKVKKDENYNPSLRNIVKLLMNSLSGKMAQRMYDTLTTVVQTEDDVLDALDQLDDNYQIDIVNHNNLYYIHGKKLDTLVKPLMPTIWGMLIYDYSREYMYDNVLTKVNPCILTETDSYVTTYEGYLYHKHCYESLYGDEMGQLEVEYENDNTALVLVGKKCCCIYDQDTNEILKATFKGVNIKRDKVVDENLINDYKNMNNKDLHQYYYNYLLNNLIGISTYTNLVEDKEVNILCSQLKRYIKPDEEIKPLMHLKQVYTLKIF